MVDLGRDGIRELLIVMGRVDDADDQPLHKQHSMVLVSRHTKGVTVESHLTVFDTTMRHTATASSTLIASRWMRTLSYWAKAVGLRLRKAGWGRAVSITA